MDYVGDEIARMVNFLPEGNQKLVFELVVRLLPDDVATRADLEAIAQAHVDHARGETVRMEDIDWN